MIHDESARDYYEENQILKAENAALKKIAKKLIAEQCDGQRCEWCYGRIADSQDCVELYLNHLIEEFEAND